MRNQRETRTRSREKMMEILSNTYPDQWINVSEEFRGSEGGIWLDAECGVTDKNGKLLFDYYNQDLAKRQFGVIEHLAKWAERAGWYFEWNDPGTIFLWEI